LAASLKQQFGIPAELAKGSRGAFDVTLDGTPVFSKHGSGRFPNPGEVEAAIASRVGPAPG
jgi:selT/selW/selH-like putative selenoprotein